MCLNVLKCVNVYSKELININTNNITNYKPSEFAELLNVSVKTLQRWDRDKVLVAKRTPTDRRYYTYDQYLEYKGAILLTFECESVEAQKKLINASQSIGGVHIAKSLQNRDKTNTRAED